MRRILVIDDDFDICQLLKRFFTKKNFEVETVNSASDAVKVLKEESFDIILCDYKLPDAEGVELLQKIKILSPRVPVVIITGYSDVKIAVETLKHGACDYVTKPLYPDEILLTVETAIEKSSAKAEVQTTAGPARVRKPPKEYVFGPSPQSDKVKRHIALIAPTDMSVIITGETGTGKEFVANAIHLQSKRSEGPFVAIDCGALPKDLAGSELFGHVKGAFTGALNDKKGSFEMAHGGTLFLDEIGNLSYDNQIKLLRVLQERKIKQLGSNKNIDIDVRVLVATNEDLKQAIKEGRFREDIYHRLNEFQIELAPLRERKEDVLVYAKHFLNMANYQLEKNVLGFSESAKENLANYYWHGNLRELQNVVKRAVLLCATDLITRDHLPEEIQHPEITQELVAMEQTPITDTENLKAASETAERQVILSTLKKASYNKSKTAKLLNIDRKTLYNKLKAYDIHL